LLFCGISITKYALPHLTPSGKKLTQNLYHTLSSTSENLVFLFIGIGFFSFEHHWKRFNWIIFALTFFVIIASRHIQITLFSRITNLFRKENKIPKSHQMVMSYSGFRGAMAFALATNAVKTYESDGAGSMMLTLTLVYASLTIFVQGSFLVPVLEYFGVRSTSSDNSYEDEDELNESGSWKRVRQSFGKVENLFAKYLLRPRNENDENNEVMQEFVDEENCNDDLPKKSPHFLSKTTEIEINSLKRHQTHRQTNIDLDSNLKQKEVRSAQEKPSSHLFED
jgi:NhaP-type Na+/H+ or K+/H+ antiporter